jgi:hypothetical protein
MGEHDRILSERAIEPALYSDWPLTIELRENIHLHYRNWRPVVTKEQFLAITDAYARARVKFDELGQPESLEDGPGLADVKLSKPLHHNRVALELCTDGSIHFHFDDTRLHVDKRTFFRLGLVFKEGLQEYCKHNSTTINLSEAEVSGTVNDVYLPWLKEYTASTDDRLDPDDLTDMLLEQKRLLRPEDEQRYSDGWSKSPEGTEVRTRSLPEEFDKKYLCTLFENIKKYGYGKGPYKYDYIRATQNGNGKIYLTGSHRAACLLHLGYTEIPVAVTN